MNTLQIGDANNSPAAGRLWAHGGEEALMRVIEFAGLPVPEDGLEINPPTGGALTVWPDGRYEFVPPIHEGSAAAQDAVSTSYGYMAEDLYGEIVAGSFVLALGEDVPDPMHDFQAWSLPELLDSAADALLAAEASGGAGLAGHDLAEFSNLASLDPALDDLTRLILDSHHV